VAKEYCERCRLPLREWEWCGRGFCEVCEDEMSKFVLEFENQDSEIVTKTAKSKDEIIEALIAYIAQTLGDSVKVSKDDMVVYE
jgi:hypothetical protein